MPGLDWVCIWLRPCRAKFLFSCLARFFFCACLPICFCLFVMFQRMKHRGQFCDGRRLTFPSSVALLLNFSMVCFCTVVFPI